MARCETCGADLQDATQRFCGGDRCLLVFMRRVPRQAMVRPLTRIRRRPSAFASGFRLAPMGTPVLTSPNPT